MRRFAYTVTWYDKGRYLRTASGDVTATSLSSACARGVREAKKKAKKHKHGWIEREGAQFKVSLVAGPALNNLTKGGRDHGTG